MPYFPNYLSLASPFAFSGLSFFNTMEYQMRHMDRLFKEVQRKDATTFEVTEEANAQFLDRMTNLLDDSVFYAATAPPRGRTTSTTAARRHCCGPHRRRTRIATGQSFR